MSRIKCTCKKISSFTESQKNTAQTNGDEKTQFSTKNLALDGDCVCEMDETEYELEGIDLSVEGENIGDMYEDRFRKHLDSFRRQLHPAISVSVPRDLFF